MIAEGVLANPEVELVLMEKHGLVTWGDTPEACYAKRSRSSMKRNDTLKRRFRRRPRKAACSAELRPSRFRRSSANGSRRR
ncbi:hypothetical protein HMSSN036_42310 [Paenibacillus macerans]|nr:hypothetical protein HMSSN036_42310 [Paenibacillus macerans]